MTITSEQILEMAKILNKNRIPTLKEEFFKRFFPLIKNPEKYQIFFPLSFEKELPPALINASWVSFSEWTDIIIAVDTSFSVNIPNFEVKIHE